MRRLLATACAVVVASGCANSSGQTTTTVFDVFGLECRTDRFESVVNDFGAVTGHPSVEETFAEFFEGEGRRFSDLDRAESTVGGLTHTFVDSDGLIQLRVQLTDEFGGYLVAGYSHCADRS